MIPKIITNTILLSSLFGVSAIASSITPVVAQTPPAQTYQPGPWQPLARVNPQRPITINVINQTGLSVDAGFTDTRRDPITVQNGRTGTIRSLESPLYLLVYVNESNASFRGIDLNYQVRVQEGSNTINVTVQRTSSDRNATMTLNVDEFGGIYLY